ncbi:undecaprenyl-diphosphate phosphatase [Rhodopirellula sp. ICT_H3.1]|uniref:Undecaprenyl-diphosphatase n=1 Tax=Aporhodopirellula aestuarii TaxID=2950107 RepID=A0ABT0UDI9_9BACT|nr:undecaprenyl-diphosphate phosphatase [Aporhodopirellula aestuarii]MCM2374958.1 undecaprenyl-diphosphate phosphatase [Aporhodopirellula aestuarii]
MPDLIRVLILAVVQGIAEFLPISSSGHLVILDDLLGGLGESATLVIILHAGTLGSILVVYWRRILKLLTSDRRVIGLLVVGTLPAVVIGLTIKRGFPWLTESPILASAMLIITGVLLILLGKLKPSEGEYTGMSWLGAFVVGCFQAVAILPGISRSGSTIVGGRLMGLSNEDSVTFSFLLAIPAILGATTLAIKDLLDGTEAASDLPITTLLIGAACAFVVGIFALKWLIRWSREARLHWFSYWCIPFGIAMLLFYASK